MRISKCILMVALALLPGTAILAARVSKDSTRVKTWPPDSIRVRYKTWSIYAAGGVSGFLDLRGYDDEQMRTTVSPDFAIGFKNNVRPWFRWGMNFGYTFLHTINNKVEQTTTTTTGYQIGAYKDATLTVDKGVFNKQHDQHMAYGDLNIDFNLFQIVRRGDHRCNLWIGTGAGYLHGWAQATRMTAYDEEAVANTDDHFNIYNHDYIDTETGASHQNALYIPGRVSLEVDLTPRWTLGFRGEYKYLPLNQNLTPTHIWSAGLSIAYNFVPKTKKTKPVVSPKQPELVEKHDTIVLSALPDTVRVVMDSLRGKVKEAEDELAACLAHPCISTETMAVSPIFFDKNRWNITPYTEKTLIFVKQLMDEYPEATLHIQGYASPEGSVALNQKLSDLRANAVRKVLINTYEIAPERISIEGCGPTDKLYKAVELNRAAILRLERPTGE